MLRIGTGIARGRRLKSVTGDIRPTGSRVRGSLFDILSAQIVDGTVLDLCAGTGILGIEALSRGAHCCLFVDRDRRAVRTIRDNLDRCGFRGSSRIWRTDAIRSLDHLADHACAVDIILADPPYGDPVAREIVRTAGERNVLAPGGLLVLEHRGDDQPESCKGLDVVRRRTIGDTALSFFRPAGFARTGEPAQAGEPDRSGQAVAAATVNRTEALPIEIPPPSSRTRR
ncbi:MAG: 16S rRNA (guanine(966)-N(2))-methyltransferase RsmD [Gemmatimonadetes bacterium]|nr:16S rRNA (guanine(966)-N(2))-methyltransferase RsmD [Gemmatimonadota bacterium]